MPTILLGFCNFTSATEEILPQWSVREKIFNGKSDLILIGKNTRVSQYTEIELSELGATSTSE